MRGNFSAAPTVVRRLAASRFDTLQKPSLATRQGAIEPAGRQNGTRTSSARGEREKDRTKMRSGEREGIEQTTDGVPEDFNASMYKLLHEDLASHTDEDARLHYEQFGKAERRIYKGPPTKLDITWAKASLARVSADWQAFPGANKSKVHLTCMTTYQSAIAEHTTTGEMERAVSSFMDTTKERSHLWVVDDGSTHDGHLRQLYALKRRYGPRLHLLLRNRNGGISAAKNSCIKAFLATSAQYLSLVDHDVEFKQYGWQESYEAAIDCGAGHLHLNIWSTEAKPGAMYTLKDLPPGNNYTDLQAKYWWVSMQLADGREDTVGAHAFLRDCDGFGPVGLYYIFSRSLVTMLGGYRVLPHKYGHEHTEYTFRAMEASKYLQATKDEGLPDSYFTPPNHPLDIWGSRLLIGQQYSNNPSVFTGGEKAAMLGENWDEVIRKLEWMKSNVNFFVELNLVDSPYTHAAEHPHPNTTHADSF